MHPRSSHLVSACLAALYSVVALGGYALHGFTGCADQERGCHASATVSRHANSTVHGACCHHAHCGGDSAAAALGDESAASSHREGNSQVGGVGHEAAHCALCRYLGQLKTAVVLLELPSFASPATDESVSITMAAPAAMAIRFADVRGPPSLQTSLVA